MRREERFYITFNEIPDGFRLREKVWIAEFALSGIQRYLLGDGDIYMTCRTLHRRSAHVENLTEAIHQHLKSSFDKKCNYRLLSRSGGKVICAFSRRALSASIEEMGKKLQAEIFASTDGALELYFAYAPAIVGNKKTNGNHPRVEGELARRLNLNKYHCVDLLFADLSDARRDRWTIDTLAPDIAEEKHFSGAGMAMKFDLDNLGLFFGQITEFDRRIAAGNALREVLEASLDQSIYIGGDDIFAVASLDDALSITASMYQRIYDGIHTRAALQLYRPHFGLSGGLCYAEIRESFPLIYYFNASEEQLECAKAINGKNHVVYEGTAISWQQLLALSFVTAREGDKLFANMTESAVHNAKKDVRYLAQHILSHNRKSNVLSSEEEQLINGIL